MKLIIAIIPPKRVSDLREELLQAGATGLTIAKVVGTGKDKLPPATTMATKTLNCLTEMAKLEILVDETHLEQVIDTILSTVKNRPYDDNGKIFVYEPLNAVRVRTGETGNPAIG